MAKFQTRHYRALAEIMQEAGRSKYAQASVDAQLQWRDTIDVLCLALQRDNPKFNDRLFAAACSPGANVNARTPEGARRGLEKIERNT